MQWDAEVCLRDSLMANMSEFLQQQGVVLQQLLHLVVPSSFKGVAIRIPGEGWQ